MCKREGETIARVRPNELSKLLYKYLPFRRLAIHPLVDVGVASSEEVGQMDIVVTIGIAILLTHLATTKKNISY